MNRRKLKKQYKIILDKITKIKLPLAFKNDQDRKRYVGFVSRKFANQTYKEVVN